MLIIMITRRKLITECSLVDISAKLAEVSTKLESGEFDFDQAQEEITKIEEEYKQQNMPQSFQQLLINAKLSDYTFSYDKSETTLVPQDQTNGLLNINRENLFRYRDTAKNKINAYFSHKVFDFLFVNRSRTNKKLNSYVTSKSEFNQAVSKLKEHFCQQIISDLKIESLSDILFFKSTGPVYDNSGKSNFEILMQTPEVIRFLSNMDQILDNPIIYSKELNTLSALYYLNNFDELISTELQGLIKINPIKKGFIDNINYVNEIQNNSTEYWADDSHEAKDIRNYTSNLAKFIMSQIPRGQKIGSKFVQYPGQYLSDKELYVLSYVLKSAEYEYNLKHLNDPDFKMISLATNTVEVARLLLQQTSLPAIKNAKQDLISSINNFLYEGDDSNFSINELFKEAFIENPKILDIESLLMYEINSAYAPTYVEFDSELTPEYKNYGGVYEQGSSLKWNLTEFMFQLFKSKKPIIDKSYYNSNSKTCKEIKNDDKLIPVIIQQVLGFDPQTIEANKQFITESTLAIKQIIKSIVEKLYNPNYAKQAKNAAKSNDDITLYNELKIEASKIITSDLHGFSTFKQKYYTLISDRVITQFDSNANTTLPSYRLNSAITSDVWFLSQYRNTQVSSEQNFLVDNPLLFSKYNTLALGENNSGINKKYKNSTAYLVDIGDSVKNIGVHELSTSDQLVTLMINNLYGIKNGLFHFQPVCFSDKISIGTKVFNLDAQFIDPTTGQMITLSKILSEYETNPNKVIKKLRNIDYYYRKNSTLALINSILTKWNTLYKLKFGETLNSGFEPILDLGFNKQEMRNKEYPNLYLEISNRIAKLNQFMSSQNFGDIHDWIKLAFKNGIELIDELDYVKVKKGKVPFKFNESIKFDFDNLQNFNTFEQNQKLSFAKLLESEEYQEVIKSLSTIIESTEKYNPIYELLVALKPEKIENKTSAEKPIYFKKEWNSKEKKYDIVPIKNDGQLKINKTFEVFSALSNLGRFAYLDIASKFEYLDPSKTQQPSEYIDRAKRIEAMAKRMVLYPATIQQYLEGKYDGVSQETKVAIIEDPSEETWNMNGDEPHKQDIYDGSGFSSPFWSMMEDNSLPGHGIHGTKKTLGTSTRGFNSTLFKWASFPINNEKMRISTKNKYSLQNLFQKMHQLKWTEDIDITQGFAKLLNRPGALVGKSLFIIDGFDYLKINTLTKTGLNTYNLSLEKVNSKGEFIEQIPDKSVVIDSIYDLWHALGGLQSGYISDIGEITFGEGSIEATFQYIINCGTYDKSGIFNQNHIHQPLRDKFIAIAANKSAVKRGGANFNTSKDVWMTSAINSDGTINPLTTFTINTSCFGVQLDANHHSDLADIREMSQTISTLAALGRTQDLAEQAYQSIAELVKISLKKATKYLTAKEQKGIDGALFEISKTLISKLAQSDKIESVDAFIEMFSEEANNLILPISDRRFYRTFIKEILEDLNKSSIRRRYTGLGGILNPASNIMQIFEFGGKQYLYSTVIEEGRKKLPKIIEQDSQIYTIDINGQQLKGTIKEFLNSKWKNRTIEQKEQDIFNLYSNILANGQTTGIQNFLNNVPAIKVISNTKNLQLIKILDTVTYSLDGVNTTTVTLDTKEKFNDFWKMIDENWDWSKNASQQSIKVYLNLATPHDLRPQYISWVSKHGENKEKLNNIYTSKAARLADSVGNIKASQDQINRIIADLSEDGQAQKLSCLL